MMEAEILVRVARAADADSAADLAVARRAEYEHYSPIFWRPAEDARERHQPFLRRCIASDDYAAFAAERAGEVVGVILGKRGAAPAPFHADPESTCFVDDFYVARPALWQTAGSALLATLTDAARAGGAERVIVVGAQRDAPKRAFLLNAGYTVAAAWWTHPVTPTPAPAPALPALQALVVPAPPVYAPGGLTALALGGVSVAQVALFTQWAAASQAVLAIIPARSTDAALAAALAAAGYAVASEWYVRTL